MTILTGTLFGNMTGGGGLSSIFDASLGTTGYAQGVVGYAGITLESPKRVTRARVWSASNGFDASGSETWITLTLRGKNGAPFTGPNDGVILSVVAFKDRNVQTYRDLFSTDTISTWGHLAVVVATGVWSVFAKVEFHDDAAIVPDPLPSNVPSVLQKSCNDGFMLPQAAVVVPGFLMTCCVPVEGVMLLDFTVNIVHRGNYLPSPFLGAVGIGAEILFRYSSDFSALDAASWQVPPVSRTNGNNVEEVNPAHYQNVSLPSSMAVVPGFYKLGLRMSGHTDGTAQNYIVGILEESGMGLNGFRATFFPGGNSVNMNADPA